MTARRTTTLLTVLLLAMSTLAAPASAQGWPDHGHLLLIGAVVEPVANPPQGSPPYRIHGFDRCVELANGRHVPLHAHHDRVHFGRAGQALIGAGHQVVPTHPIFPNIHTCDDLRAALPYPSPS
jgi:hypothetical protein